MIRAHVEMDNEQVANIMTREFSVDHRCSGCEPEVTIVGYLTEMGTKPPVDHQNCKCKWFPVLHSIDIEKVIYHNPATIIYWGDGTRTVVKCQPGDTYDPKLGFLMALCKKVCGNTGNYNDLLREYVPGYGEKED